MPNQVHEILLLDTIKAKCQALRTFALDVFEAREERNQLDTELPQVLQHIFIGTENSNFNHLKFRAWIITESYKDKEALINLLLPTSPLIKHVILHSADSEIIYELPIGLLPLKYEMMIVRGEISALPPWLSSKLNSQKLPQYLKLSTLEYYVYLFAAHGVGVSRMWKGCQPTYSQSTDSNAKNDQSNALWSNPLDLIAGGFSKKQKEEEKKDERIDSSHAYTYLFEEYMRFFVHCSFNLPSWNTPPTSYLDQEFYSLVRSDYPSISTTILRITLDFWLAAEDASNPTAAYIVPDDIIVEGLIIGLKALMRGLKTMRSDEKPNAPPSSLSSMRTRTPVSTQEELFGQIMFNSIRYPLYQFMARAFEYRYWESHTIRILKYLIQMWLMCIRPWGLSQPSWMVIDDDIEKDNQSQHGLMLLQPDVMFKTISTLWARDNNHRGGKHGNGNGGGGNASGHGGSGHSASSQAIQQQARRDYIASNFLLYTPLLSLYLRREISLTNKKELKMLNLMMDSWANDDFLDPLLEVDAAIETYLACQKRYEMPPPHVNYLALTALDAIKLVKNLSHSPLRRHATAVLASKHFHVLQSVITASSKKVIIEQATKARSLLAIVFNMDANKESAKSPLPINFGQEDRLPSNRRVPASVAIRDAQYRGDWRLHPVTSTESVFLVRSAYRLSMYLKKKHGLDLDLRLLGSLRIYAWAAVICVFFLILMGFWSFIELLTSGDEGGTYNYSRNQKNIPRYHYDSRYSI